MLTFTVTDQTSLCVSLRSYKCVECIFFLIKHFQADFFWKLSLHPCLLAIIPASVGTLQHFLACYRHLWISGTACNRWQGCASRHWRAHPCARDKQNVDPLINKLLLHVRNSTGYLLFLMLCCFMFLCTQYNTTPL